MKKTSLALALAAFGFLGQAHAQLATENIKNKIYTVTVKSISASGVGKSIGTVKLQDTAYGLLLTPNLTGLSPGLHGFHVHEKPTCEPAKKDGQTKAGQAAGDHLNHANSNSHKGPYQSGHLGDLPALYVESTGLAVLPLLAPKLKARDVIGRSLMIHAGGDNYADQPKPLGGGGDRVACGVLKR